MRGFTDALRRIIAWGRGVAIFACEAAGIFGLTLGNGARGIGTLLDVSTTVEHGCDLSSHVIFSCQCSSRDSRRVGRNKRRNRREADASINSSTGNTFPIAWDVENLVYLAAHVVVDIARRERIEGDHQGDQRRKNGASKNRHTHLWAVVRFSTVQQ